VTPFWKNLVIYARIIVMEPDDGAFNHLLQLKMVNRQDYLVSYTGPIALGQEGREVRLRLQDVSCKEVIGCEEHPTIGPIGYRAWICDAEKATLLED
jgi:hypothetical protein